MNLEKNLKFRLSFFAKKARVPLWATFLSFNQCREFESKLIESVRQNVYSRLIHEGCLKPELPGFDQSRVMVIGMFERCGIFSRALEAELNLALGFSAFQFKSIGGHYVVKSEVTDLIYDLVTTRGLPEKAKFDLDYAEYLNDKVDGIMSPDEIAQKYVRRYKNRTIGCQ